MDYYYGQDFFNGDEPAKAPDNKYAKAAGEQKGTNVKNTSPGSYRNNVKDLAGGISSHGTTMADDTKAPEDAKTFSDSIPETNESWSQTRNKDPANGMNARDTLRYSRLADALNSKDWVTYDPTNVSLRGGGVSGGGVKNLNIKDVNTAEMRAQNRNEQYENTEVVNEQTRRDLYKKFPYEMKKAVELAKVDMAKNANSAELSAMLNAVAQTLQQDNVRFNHDEQLRYYQEVANILASPDTGDATRLYLSQLFSAHNTLTGMKAYYLQQRDKAQSESDTAGYQMWSYALSMLEDAAVNNGANATENSTASSAPAPAEFHY